MGEVIANRRVMWVTALAVASSACEQLLGAHDPTGIGGTLVDSGTDKIFLDGHADADTTSGCARIPSWAAPVKYSALDAATIAVGDVDHDGIVDLVVGTGTSQTPDIVIFKGNGNGTLGASRTMSATPTIAFDLEIADVDDDGFNDVVYLGSNSTVFVRRQNPAAPGNFLAPQTITTGQVARFLVGKLDGDALVDVLMVANDFSLRPYFARPGSPGVYDPAPSSLPSSNAFPDRLVDVDADGLDDIVIRGTSTVSILYNRATSPGTFDAPVAVGTDASAELGRFSPNAPRRDLFAMEIGGAKLYHQNAPRVFVGDPVPLPIPVATRLSGMLDINGDGRDDLLAGTGGVLQCAAPAPPGAFYTPDMFQPQVQIPIADVYADLNTDGKPDTLTRTDLIGAMHAQFIAVGIQQ